MEDSVKMEQLTFNDFVKKFDGIKNVSCIEGVKPTQKTLPLKIFECDYRYQRITINRTRIREIVTEFDPNLMGTFEIAERTEMIDGKSTIKYYIMDGHHRGIAFRKLGIEKVPCNIHKTTCYQEEAVIFQKFNQKRTNLHPIDNFKALVAGGKPESIRLNNIIINNNFYLSRGSKANNSIRYIRTLEKAYENYPDLVERILIFIRDICCPNPTDEEIFRGFIYIAIQNKEIFNRFDKILKNGGYINIKNSILAVKSNSIYRWNCDKSYAEAILMVANKGSRNKIVIE